MLWVSHSTYNRSFWWRVFPANHLTMVVTKQTYNAHDKQKKHTKLNLTKPYYSWFSHLLLHPARKCIGPILTKNTAPGARTDIRCCGLWRLWCCNVIMSVHLTKLIYLKHRYYASKIPSSSSFSNINNQYSNDYGLLTFLT